VRPGGLPAAPAGFGVVHGEQPVARAAEDRGQPAERDGEEGRDAGRSAAGRPPARCGPCRRPGGRHGRPRLDGPPREFAVAGDVASVDHIASPSSSVQSLGGASLGRCCGTGPAACPGDGAADGRAEPGSLPFLPRMPSRGSHAPAERKRMRSLRADRHGSASPHVARSRGATPLSPVRTLSMARGLLPVTLGHRRPRFGGSVKDDFCDLFS
jgi:hypothetical protein